MVRGESKKLRREIVETCLAINRLGINQGTSGNVSPRAGEGFLITPSGAPYDAMRPSRSSRWTSRAGISATGCPPSEWRMHLDIFRARPEAAVVHTHSTYATALSCLPGERHRRRLRLPRARSRRLAPSGGAEPFPLPPYSRDWGETGEREVLAEGARTCMIEVEPSQAGPGALLLFRMTPRAIAKHVGILTGPDRFIHAYEQLGVIEEPLAMPWAPAFRLRLPVPARRAENSRGRKILIVSRALTASSAPATAGT